MRLRPFSFWHSALLDALESPFAGHEKPINFVALYLAAEVCQLRFPQSLHPGSRIPYLASRLSRLLWFRRCVQKPGLFHRQLNAFSTYLQDYNSRPICGSSEDSRPVQTPWYLYQVVALLRADPRLTHAQAWDMPVGEGAWLHVAHLEASGARIDLLTPELEQAFSEAGIPV